MADTSDRPTLAEVGLNFRRHGYFTRMVPRDLDEPGEDGWIVLGRLIGRLAGGEFDAAPLVLECSRQSTDWRLRKVATQVLGHAGTVDCFRDMRAELEKSLARVSERVDVETRQLILLYCHAFANWGRLDVIPFLMDQYLTLRLKKTPEIEIIPVLMADLLTDEPGTMLAHEPNEEHIEDYLNLVMQQYDALCESLGSDKALVYRGALQSVTELAERMRHLKSDYVASALYELRTRFESATGIDCSEIFREPSVRPLIAAEIAERFLESPAAKDYEPGARYFFGHRIPD